MIILDTNVVSEPLRPAPDAKVVAWLDRQVANTLYLTSINLAELLAGVGQLPDGARRRGLGMALEELLDQLFGGRVLPFDRDAAKAYASLTATARNAGLAISLADGLIAAIAKVHAFTVATRDVDPFVAVGVAVIDPWSA